MRKRGLLLAALVLGAGALFAARGCETHERIALPAPVAVERAEAAEGPATPEPAEPAPPQDDGTRARAEAPRAADEDAEPATAPAAEAPPARVLGRFLLPGGAPAPGVSVRLRGWQSNNQRVMEHGLPESWEDPVTRSDADGRFELELDPPRAFQFVLEAELAGTAGASWRWSEIAPGARVDVGTVRLLEGGTLVVRMQDAAGEPIRSGWTVHGEAAVVSSGGREATRRRATLDPASGTARLADLPPGPVKLSAHSRIANWIQGGTVEVAAGEETHATLRYDGPDNSRRIVVVAFTRPFYSQMVGEEAMRISGGAIEPRAALKIPQSSQSFAFDDLPPGSYTVTVEDPRYELWTRHGVAPGTRLDARLRGSAGVQLAVVDADTASPLERYELRLRFEGSTWRPNEFQLLAPKDEPPPNGLYEGLPASDVTLVVAAEGHATLELPLGQLAPGEARAVTARMARAALVRGRVSHSDGSPVAGAQVQLAAEDVPPALVRPGVTRFPPVPEPVAWTTTDERGRFELASAPPGTWVLRAVPSSWIFATSAPFELAAGQELDVPLSLPPTGSVRGRIVVPEGESLAGCQLFLHTDAPAPTDDFLAERGLPLELDAGGRFAGTTLPLGSARLVLRGPPSRVPSGYSSSFHAQAPELELAALSLSPDEPEHELEIDLRGRWFGSLLVRATRDGAPLRGHVVEAHGSEDARGAHSAALTDEQGVAELTHLTAGEWTVSVRPASWGWSSEAPHPVRVEPGRSTRVDLAADLVAGTLQLLDAATREPLPHLAVHVGPRDGAAFEHRSDAEGRVALELPPGPYLLRLPSPRPLRAGGPMRSYEIDWTPQGPSDPTVLLEVPAEED